MYCGLGVLGDRIVFVIRDMDIQPKSSPRQKFTVSQEDGLDELKKDILGCYKNPQINLNAKPRVKFEGETGVGSGPIREFRYA